MKILFCQNARFWSRLVFLTTSLLLTSCMVGPDFKKPCPPNTKNTYTYAPLPKKTVHSNAAGKAGQTQYFLVGDPLSPTWWTQFHSPEINQLVLQGLSHSPTLDAAIATLQQAKDTLQAQIGALLLPAVTGQLTGNRQHFSGASQGTTSKSLFNLFNASVSVSFTLDVWGGLRRQVEFYQAAVDYQRYQMAAAYLTLTSNIVTTAITASALQAEIEATQFLLTQEEKQLTILKKQFELGGIAKQNVLTQETQVANTRALIPDLRKRLAQSLDALAVLLGCAPSEIRLPKIALDHLTLPATIPITLPSVLVEHRPDIKASESLLHQASAQIGVATANLLPQFPLTANYGYESAVLGTLFNKQNVVWSYGGSILQTIFNGGSLIFQRKAAIDAYHAAFFQYQQTVLQAFQNVADALSALEWDARALKAETEAERAAEEGLILTTEQFNLGAINYLALLIAEQQYQQALINRIRAAALRYNDTVALFIALGGSWWIPTCYPCAPKVAAKLNAMT